MYKYYIGCLKNGKQIRIKYNKRFHDCCEDDGWWSEELWCYDSNLDLFKCYYPISSYDKDFFTNHTQSETESFLRESIRDSNPEYGEVTVTDIVVEDCNIPVSSLSIREQVIKMINMMTDEELKRLFL